MKLTLVGRPTAVQTNSRLVACRIAGTLPPNLPKDLPPLPAHAPVVWEVLIGLKQWNRGKGSLASDPEDRLVVEGYPFFQGERRILYVTTCRSVAQERARKAEQQAVSAAGS